MGLTSSTMLSTLAHDEAGAGSAWCLTLLRVWMWSAGCNALFGAAPYGSNPMRRTLRLFAAPDDIDRVKACSKGLCVPAALFALG